MIESRFSIDSSHGIEHSVSLLEVLSDDQTSRRLRNKYPDQNSQNDHFNCISNIPVLPYSNIFEVEADPDIIKWEKRNTSDRKNSSVFGGEELAKPNED